MSAWKQIKQPVERNMWRTHQKILIWIAAGGFNFLGLIWLYTFFFTKYRGHWANVMIPAGIISLMFSYGLFCQKISSVFSLIFLAAGSFIAAVYMQIAQGIIHPFLFAIAVVSAIYICILGPPLLKALKGNRTPKH